MSTLAIISLPQSPILLIFILSFEHVFPMKNLAITILEIYASTRDFEIRKKGKKTNLSVSLCTLLKKRKGRFCCIFFTLKKLFLQMPTVEPFIMDTLSLQLTGGPQGYRISLKNMEIFGASNYTVHSIK